MKYGELRQKTEVLLRAGKTTAEIAKAVNRDTRTGRAYVRATARRAGLKVTPSPMGPSIDSRIRRLKAKRQKIENQIAALEAAS